jgi:uncharacterized protein involved in exopolysaccharide biosynthesis
MNWTDVLKITPDVIVVGIFLFTVRSMNETIQDLRSKYDKVLFEIEQIKRTLKEITVIKIKEE